ncbi:MAG: dipeptidase [bacterium]|nr:dipeptidase [bacterium]
MSRLLFLFLIASLAGCATTGTRDPAVALHFDAIVVDGHSDTTPRFADPRWSFTERHDDGDGDMDLPRIREGGLDVQFWSVYTGKLGAPGDGLRIALERIDAVHEMARRNPDDVVVAHSVAELRAAVAEGKFVSLMGIEGGHIIEESLPALRLFHRLGVRYLTLTHSFNTTWADSSGTTTIPEPTHGGLTDFGRDVVREMNRLGMLVDVSHVSDATFFDAIETSRAPVIASHSSVRAVADHTRNMSDEMLRALAENGGVVMINFYPAYIDEETAQATSAWFRTHGPTLMERREALADDPERLAAERTAFFEANPVPVCDLDVLLDHFDRAIEVAGPDHVGLGADWDGVISMPAGMEDVTKLPDLTAGLLARGHPPETVRKVLGENVLRALEAAERVAAEMATEARTQE